MAYTFGAIDLWDGRLSSHGKLQARPSIALWNQHYYVGGLRRNPLFLSLPAAQRALTAQQAHSTRFVRSKRFNLMILEKAPSSPCLIFEDLWFYEQACPRARREASSRRRSPWSIKLFFATSKCHFLSSFAVLLWHFSHGKLVFRLICERCRSFHAVSKNFSAMLFDVSRCARPKSASPKLF